MKLHTLLPPYGEKNKKIRVGRGNSSGKGNYSGKGMRGAKSRKGRPHYPGFEGGQMPLYRRLPKRGFTPLTRERYREINISSLNRFKKEKEITPEIFYKEGFIKRKDEKIKILGDGELEITLTVKAHKFSSKAKEKIEKKGGKAIEIVKEPKRLKAVKAKEKKVVEEKKIEEKVDAEKAAKKEKKVEGKEKKTAKKKKTAKAKKIAKSKGKDKTKTKGKKRSSKQL
jgi:large subunit ribosomal protein L15